MCRHGRKRNALRSIGRRFHNAGAALSFKRVQVRVWFPYKGLGLVVPVDVWALVAHSEVILGFAHRQRKVQHHFRHVVAHVRRPPAVGAATVEHRPAAVVLLHQLVVFEPVKGLRHADHTVWPPVAELCCCRRPPELQHRHVVGPDVRVVDHVVFGERPGARIFGAVPYLVPVFQKLGFVNFIQYI